MRHLDFDTSSGGEENGRASRHSGPKSSRSSGWRHRFATGVDRNPSPAVDPARAGTFEIPAGSRKAALVHLGLAAWRQGLLDPKEVGQVRGRQVDEVGLQRALYRSSIGEIEHLLGPILKGSHVIVEGRLAGSGRTALDRLGAQVEELRLEDEKRYVDMTPAIFVVAAVAMAVRYVSLGLDDQALYILSGMALALMYGLRPFFSKIQGLRD